MGNIVELISKLIEEWSTQRTDNLKCIVVGESAFNLLITHVDMFRCHHTMMLYGIEVILSKSVSKESIRLLNNTDTLNLKLQLKADIVNLLNEIEKNMTGNYKTLKSASDSVRNMLKKCDLDEKDIHNYFIEHKVKI